MFGKFFSTAIILLAICFAANAQTENKITSAKTLNGAAKSLPKPVYPPEAKNACADGLVNVEVTINENGDVISAAAVSGDELLRDSAVEAAKKAKFSPFGDRVKVKGIIAYNFVLEKKCIEAGIVNKRAISIPKPRVGNINLKNTKETTIQVQVIIDLLTGKVTRAKALPTGHPLILAACEDSARQAKFHPFYHGAGILVKAIIVYKFKPDGTIEV